MIPFGQPILAGHHSQRRDERNRERIHNTYAKAFAELEESQRLTGAAASSRRHQAYKETAPAMSRRADRLRAEERQLTRIISGLTERAAAGEEVTTYRQQCDWRLEQVRAELAELDAKIKDAGGLLADQLEVHVGDLVYLRGQLVRITRVNRKTYSGVMVTANAALARMNWDRKYEREDLRGILRRADEPKTQEEILIEQTIAAQEAARQHAIEEMQRNSPDE